VAGAIAGIGKDSKGKYKGVAPGANIIGLRVLDDNGAGRDSDVIAAIDRAIALKSTYNIRVINLSLGRPVMESYTRDPLCQAVEKAWKAGIVVVVAAGNNGRDNTQNTSGYGTITSPGNDPHVITVGAMKNMGTVSRADDQIASYSSKGPTLIDHVVKPDIVAPGNRVIGVSTKGDSRLEKSYPGNRQGAAYFRMSGTSMATPVVSGAVALMLEKEPGLTPDQVKARLMKSATKSFPSYSVATDPVTGQVFTSQYDIFTVGAGYLDIWEALQATETGTARATSPKATFDSASGSVGLLCDKSALWGDSALWGETTLWGETIWSACSTSITWGTSAVWGTRVFVNGSSTLWGTDVVWGTQSMSGFSALWGESTLWGTGHQPRSENVSILINGEN
jgi:serine protease AprX